MKSTTLFATVATLLATACTQPSGKFTIQGQLPDSTLHGNLVTIYDYDTRQVVDSTTVDGDSFTFNGEADSTRACLIQVSNTRMQSAFILENGVTNIHFNENLPSSESATPLNRELAQRVARYDSINALIASERNSFMAARPDATAAHWNEFYNLQLRDSVDRLIAEMFHGLGDDAVGLLLTPTLRNASLDKQLEIIATLSPSLQQTQTVSQRKTLLEGLKNTRVGKPFTDIVGTNLQGDTVALADYIGKGNYVLMDVWASWCGPCKQQIPYLARLHNLYKDKGLTVVGVFVWDKPQNLAPALEAEGITWPQIIDSDQNATRLYGIGGIPEIILFAPDGTIVEREDGMRGKQLIEKVEGHLKAAFPHAR